MTSRIELIKELRSKGASIRMIDDVAIYLDKNGGYNSPVFIATVEFIIKLKDMLKSVMHQYEQTAAINTEIVEKAQESVENVNFTAAKTAVNNDEEMPDGERQVVIDHIDAIELYKDQNLESQHTQEEYLPQQGGPFANNLKRTKQKGRQGKDSILDKLFKIAAILGIQKNIHKQQQTQETQQRNARNISARQQEQINVQNINQRASLLRMALTKMNLLSSLKVRKDRSIYGDAQWREKQAALTAKPQNEKLPDRREQIINNQNTIQRQNARSPKDKTAQEISISQVIDEAVKSSRSKKTVAVEKPPSEKGKFEKDVIARTGAPPRANDVKEMATKDAIANLQNSGVKASSTNVKIKPEIEVQAAQMTPAQQAQMLKQR